MGLVTFIFHEERSLPDTSSSRLFLPAARLREIHCAEPLIVRLSGPALTGLRAFSSAMTLGFTPGYHMTGPSALVTSAHLQIIASGVSRILSPLRSRMIRLTPDAPRRWFSTDCGCVADQPQHHPHFHPLRLVEDDTAAFRSSRFLSPNANGVPASSPAVAESARLPRERVAPNILLHPNGVVSVPAATFGADEVSGHRNPRQAPANLGLNAAIPSGLERVLKPQRAAN